MSSYVESPFSIEQRRLQGIVKQCQNDLKNAINQVDAQIKHIKEMSLKQKEKDASYYSDQQKIIMGLLETIESEKRADQIDKDEIDSYMHILEIQILTFHNTNGGMELAIERQQQLRKIIKKGLMSVNMFRKELKKHGEKTSEEMISVIEQRSKDIIQRHNHRHNIFMIGQEGVSLQIENQSDNQTLSYKSPLTLFTEKMEEVLSSPYADNTSSLHALIEEFDNQPEYSKPEYALRNMNRIDDYIYQFKRLDEVQKSRKKKWERLIKRYYAICKLTKETPKDELTVNIDQASLLNKHYQELCRRYQQINEQKYVFKAVSAVMERHGIILTRRTSAVSEVGMEFALDDTTSVIVDSNSHRNISMDVHGSFFGQIPTLNDKRKAVTTAKKFCSVIKVIEQELKNEYGIAFNDVWSEEPSEETIVMNKISDHSNNEYYLRERTLKEKSLS